MNDWEIIVVGNNDIKGKTIRVVWADHYENKFAYGNMDKYDPLEYKRAKISREGNLLFIEMMNGEIIVISLADVYSITISD